LKGGEKMLEKYQEIGPVVVGIKNVHYFMVWFFRDRRVITVTFLKRSERR